MENGSEKFSILRITGEGRNRDEGLLAREFPLTVVLNNEELVTLLCSPSDLKYLAVGFLYSEGLLSNKEDIKKLVADEQNGIIRIETTRIKESNPDLFRRILTSACGRGISFYSETDTTSYRVTSDIKIPAEAVFNLVNQFQHESHLYSATRGVHSAALCDSKSLLVFSEDIGRHNAIDKIFGRCLLEDIPISDRIIITSGRISSEILHKVAKRGIPIVISISVPTNLAVRIAEDLGITLVGMVIGKRRMNVYCHHWRVI